jgi:osmoprotectant transport system permease protein
VKLKTRDNIALAAVVLGLVACILGWQTLKPNRLASGNSLNFGASLGWGWGATLIFLWCLCLLAIFVQDKKSRAMLLGLAANAILILTVVLTGTSAIRLLQSAPQFARVSPGSGIWLTLIAVYVLIFAVRRGLKEWPVWQNVLTWGGLIFSLGWILSGHLNQISVMQEYISQKGRFFQELQQHVVLFASSIAAGILIGIPLGIWAFQNRKAERPIFVIANITQTIPSLALFGLLIAPLSLLSRDYPFLREIGIKGIGTTPALIALIIYSLLPVVQNTYIGLRELNPAMIEAAKGMGMSRFMLFRKIELPLAAPIILEGVRTAAVQAVGNTAVAALIGAGGLGQFIFQGLGQAASDLIILGAIPIILLALVVDSLMRVVIKVSAPAGARESS